MSSIKFKLENALIETNQGMTGGGLIGEIGDVAARLMAALNKRGVILVQQEGTDE
jgi:hypothetical protein